MHRLTIIGNLGKDAEVKNFNGKNVINFSVAVTENWKDKDGNKQSKAYWYECSRWTENTNIAQYLKKGCKVLAEGVPEPRAYVGQDGQAKCVQGVRITNIQILSFVEENSKPNYTTQPAPDYNKGAFTPPKVNADESDNLPF